MKKLFTFAAAVLFTASLMAQTTVIKWGAEAERVGQFTCNHSKVTLNTVKIHENTDTKPAVKFESSYKYSETEKISLTIKPAEGGFKAGDVVTMALCFSNSSNDKVAKLAIYAADGATQLYLSPAAINGRTSAADPEELTYTLLADQDSLFIGRADANTTTFLTTLEIERPATCEDPEAHLTFNKSTAYVGDQFSYNYSSKNGGALNDSYTLNGDPAVQGTDYTFSSGNLTVLKAGQFVMHRTVDEQDGYCAVDVSDTILISEKTPVTSFDVEGPTSARVGDEITLTAKDFNAAPTRVWWLDASTGEEIHEGATYTFTASKYGTFEYLVLARNDFNDPDEESYDYAFGVFGAVEISVGTDASLSDLKVNGATIEGFDATVLEYNLELGVYEALKVEATPTDAPYATAEVVDDNEGKVTVTVTAQNTHTQEYIINYTRGAKTELVAVSDSLTWDWAKAGSKTAALDGTTLPTNSEEFNFADVLSGQDASFKAESLIGRGQYANGGGYAQVNMLKFHADKNGSIIVKFSNTGSSSRPDRVLLVNDVETEYKSGTSASEGVVTTDKISVAAGDVVIEALEMKETPVKNMIRVYSLTYVPNKGETAIDNIEAGQVVKAIENGQLVIIKNGIRYNAQGAVVK